MRTHVTFLPSFSPVSSLPTRVTAKSSLTTIQLINSFPFFCGRWRKEEWVVCSGTQDMPTEECDHAQDGLIRLVSVWENDPYIYVRVTPETMSNFLGHGKLHLVYIPHRHDLDSIIRPEMTPSPLAEISSWRGYCENSVRPRRRDTDPSAPFQLPHFFEDNRERSSLCCKDTFVPPLQS
ncbi:hypothetical protein F5I97DRAFT_353434 [Phlebopus sp. FC_14]|nr:hypothetical protein F5I97DRAFT_353434 [Phlebopus sp. FC_14]